MHACMHAYYFNGLSNVFQSADKRFHSTETALIRVHNDIAVTIDNQNSVILLLLDSLTCQLSFDTVDHNILLSRLSSFSDYWKCVKVVSVVSLQPHAVCQSE